MPAANRLSPPELLAEMLREDRARGFGFEDVWDEDLEVALSSTSDRTSWRSALEATQDAWRSSWSNTPGRRSQLTPDLADDARERTVPSPAH
jgi:hypothetical protein